MDETKYLSSTTIYYHGDADPNGDARPTRRKLFYRMLRRAGVTGTERIE
jgi:hypothetical protein